MVREPRRTGGMNTARRGGGMARRRSGDGGVTGLVRRISCSGGALATGGASGGPGFLSGRKGRQTPGRARERQLVRIKARYDEL